MEEKEITQQSTLADFLYILGDVAAGKISFTDACKNLADRDKERAKKFFDTAKKSFDILKESIKERKEELDMKAKYDLNSALKVKNTNGTTSYVGVKPKQQKSWFKQMFENTGRSLKNIGTVLTGEKTIEQALKDEAEAVRESLSSQSNIYRGVRAALEVTDEKLKAFIKRKNELRGIKTHQTTQPIKETNPYDKLDNTQFQVAMHTAYANIVRMQHFGPNMSDIEKDKALTEINRLMESAQRRLPDSKSEAKGTYFTNPKLQNAEAQLLGYMKTAEAKYGKSSNDDMMKYDAWRQGQDFTIPIGNKMLSETPYNNTEVYISSSTKDQNNRNFYNATDHLRNPLKAGRNVMTKDQISLAKKQLESLKIH